MSQSWGSRDRGTSGAASQPACSNPQAWSQRLSSGWLLRNDTPGCPLSSTNTWGACALANTHAHAHMCKHIHTSIHAYMYARKCSGKLFFYLDHIADKQVRRERFQCKRDLSFLKDGGRRWPAKKYWCPPELETRELMPQFKEQNFTTKPHDQGSFHRTASEKECRLSRPSL